LPEVETSGGEQRVAAIASAALPPVAAQQAVVLGVADDGFDDRPALQPAFDLVGDAAFLPGDVHRRVGMTGETAPLVSWIDRGAQRTASDDVLDVVESRFSVWPS
jgi:hypothetical protein